MGRITKITVIAGVLCAAVASGAYFWYGSFDACDWYEQDMAARLDAPRMIARAAIKTKFLLDGITEHTFRDCLHGWWNDKTEDLSADG